MKITLESARHPEPEVIIRGDIGSSEVTALLQILQRKNSSKLVLYKEEEQFIVPAGDIVFLETSGNKLLAYTQSDCYEAKLKLYEVKELLSAHPFAQISKSTIVNIDHVKSIQAEFSGNYRIRLKSRKESLTISRKYFKDFRDRI